MLGSRVPQRAFERLELHEGKLSRAVPRGGGGGNATSLPGADGKGRRRLSVTADAYGLTNPGIRRNLASRLPYENHLKM